ncbi:apoptogenic protein 1 [Tropilaelaps mercedesae]|uniref:Apoptogenic protein 1 n=1 Tax=Tropilaelaps mercedesae TaxID=418985 RepID=A0A1V9XXI9_9ACAR|nr:apoptogenic protein 1 [Tropilaelaps mercedesae]
MSLIRRVIMRLRLRKEKSEKNPEEFLQRRGEKAQPKIDMPDTLLTHTVVTPPHRVSNLRRVHVRMPRNETVAERIYREAYDEVQRWNHHYWIEHNRLFQRERARFVMENSPAGNPQQLDANKMAVFYKRFLNDNQEKHWRYNLEWYHRHFSLLPLDVRARWSRLKIDFFGVRHQSRR